MKASQPRIQYFDMTVEEWQAYERDEHRSYLMRLVWLVD